MRVHSKALVRRGDGLLQSLNLETFESNQTSYNGRIRISNPQLDQDISQPLGALDQMQQCQDLKKPASSAQARRPTETIRKFALVAMRQSFNGQIPNRNSH
jgi:hypothetical protein